MGRGFVVGQRLRSVLSDEPLTYAVAASVAGEPWAPGVSTTVSGAYLAGPLDQPTLGDWKAGVFEVSTIGTVVALIPCGPGTINDLARGTWYEWLKVDDPATGATPVRQVGRVIVQ